MNPSARVVSATSAVTGHVQTDFHMHLHLFGSEWFKDIRITRYVMHATLRDQCTFRVWCSGAFTKDETLNTAYRYTKE